MNPYAPNTNPTSSHRDRGQHKVAFPEFCSPTEHVMLQSVSLPPKLPILPSTETSSPQGSHSCSTLSQPLPSIASIQFNLGPHGQDVLPAPKTLSLPDLRYTLSPLPSSFFFFSSHIWSQAECRKAPTPCSLANSFYLTSAGHSSIYRLSPHPQLIFYLIFQSSKESSEIKHLCVFLEALQIN